MFATGIAVMMTKVRIAVMKAGDKRGAIRDGNIGEKVEDRLAINVITSVWKHACTDAWTLAGYVIPDYGTFIRYADSKLLNSLFFPPCQTKRSESRVMHPSGARLSSHSIGRGAAGKENFF